MIYGRRYYSSGGGGGGEKKRVRDRRFTEPGSREFKAIRDNYWAPRRVVPFCGATDGGDRVPTAYRRDNVIRENPIFLSKKNDLHKPFTGNGETELRRVKARKRRVGCRRRRRRRRRGVAKLITRKYERYA